VEVARLRSTFCLRFAFDFRCLVYTIRTEEREFVVIKKCQAFGCGNAPPRSSNIVIHVFRRPSSARIDFAWKRSPKFKMVEVKKYQLPPTDLIPNSRYPLLHYPNLLSGKALSADKVHDVFAENGWQTQWIFRYGQSQTSHYHSAAHECMAVLCGTATIRFGVADTTDDLDESTHGNGKEQGGIELHAKAGDVFVIPAGVSHKTFDPPDGSTFQLLTPGEGHQIQADDIHGVLANTQLSGFTMIGAYPAGAMWDFAVGGEHKDNYEKVWSVPKPPYDPVLGQLREGLCGQWE
jgi:uncharacterized protein YjlB